MAFVSINNIRMSKFNSSASMEFLDRYEEYTSKRIAEERYGERHRTFAPSSFRCKRKNWFRLRGTEPDKNSNIDFRLDYLARMGTSIHAIVQQDIINMPGVEWVNIREYMESNFDPSEYILTEGEIETKIEFTKIPLRLAVDGIIKIDGVYYLLEIKSCELSTFNDLTKWKDEHYDQAVCYATVLKLNHILFLYVDRSYGDMKCYQADMNNSIRDNVMNTFDEVIKCAKSNIPPSRLPKGDKWCGMCEYRNKCYEWG